MEGKANSIGGKTRDASEQIGIKTTAMDQIKIPIISQDLRQDEVCLRALYTFEFLDKAVDEVFDRIDARIARNMTRLEDVNKRLEKAASKIEQLKESKKAIRIYSPAKYPVAKPPTFVPTLFGLSEKEINFDYNLQVPSESIDGKKYSDKLQFFHLKRNRPQVSNKPSVLATTKSVNSLITFVNNSNIILNEPAVKTRVKDNQSLPCNESDDTTDFSRFSSLMKSKHDADGFHYFPNVNQAPHIELPMDLPDLPGIADDISFSVTDQELIAPSLAKMNIVNELPNVAELIEAESSKKMQEAAKQETKNPEQKQSVAVPPAPPIPNIPPPPPVPQNIIPSPPPPPMLPPLSSKSEPTASLPAASDARSSLLQAIRSAGGKAKLRSVPAADEQEPQSSKKKPQAAPAGDLMSDLHAKLAMRRRGIAGSKEAKKEKASIMDKVSSLIPPPVKRDSTDDSASSDSDWNN